MTLVSVIIPYYKKKNYIISCLNSVLRQSYKNLEVIIIYDDNDKYDLSFIKALVSKDKRIKLLINDKKIGAGLSRNKGIKFSNGDYVAFLDADDLWKKEKIKKQINFMKRNKIEICHTSYKVINKNDIIESVRVARSFFFLPELLKSCDIGLSTVIVKRNLINNAFKFANLRTKEDFVLWLKLLKSGKAIVGLNSSYTYWRKTTDSLSSSSVQKLFDGFKVYNRYMNFSCLKSLYYLTCLSLNYLKKNKK
jgi:teichuronic acid biosynthesis glycosyltransferase TuaG